MNVLFVRTAEHGPGSLRAPVGLHLRVNIDNEPYTFSLHLRPFSPLRTHHSPDASSSCRDAEREQPRRSPSCGFSRTRCQCTLLYSCRLFSPSSSRRWRPSVTSPPPQRCPGFRWRAPNTLRCVLSQHGNPCTWHP